MRAHAYVPIVNDQGDLLQGRILSARILENNTNRPVSVPVYRFEMGDRRINPADFRTTTGIFEFYLDDPERIDLAVRQLPSTKEILFQDIDLTRPVPKDTESLIADYRQRRDLLVTRPEFENRLMLIPAGPPGPPGPIGIAGPVGPPGPVGPRASIRHFGVGSPGTIIGSHPGDEYLDTTTGLLYYLT